MKESLNNYRNTVIAIVYPMTDHNFTEPREYLPDHHPRTDSPRHKLHRLLSDNYALRETITQLHSSLKTTEQQKRQLKQQLRMALDELTSSDRTIATLRTSELEYQHLIKRLDEDLLVLEEELAAQKLAVESLMELNRNLETQNSLIAEIKQKYSDDLAKTKLEAEYHRCECVRMQSDNQMLTAQIKRLLQELSHYQSQMAAKRNELQDYESFVLQKLAQAKQNPDFHAHCQAQIDHLTSKYLKYKHKAHHLKEERDHCLHQLGQIWREMDGKTLREYLKEGEEVNS